MLQKSNLKDWKQTLCMIMCYADNEKQTKDLLVGFGERLSKAGELIGAMACFMVSSDLGRLFGVWSDIVQESNENYHRAVEKIFSFSSSPGVNRQIRKEDRTAVTRKYGEYAQFLVAQGHVEIAAQFLKQIKDGGDEVKKLLQRIDISHPELNIFPRQQPIQQKRGGFQDRRQGNRQNRGRIPEQMGRDKQPVRGGRDEPPVRQPPRSTGRNPPPDRNNPATGRQPGGRQRPMGRGPTRGQPKPIQNEPQHNLDRGGRRPPTRKTPEPEPVQEKSVSRPPPRGGRQPRGGRGSQSDPPVDSRRQPPPRGGNRGDPSRASPVERRPQQTREDNSGGRSNMGRRMPPSRRGRQSSDNSSDRQPDPQPNYTQPPRGGRDSGGRAPPGRRVPQQRGNRSSGRGMPQRQGRDSGTSDGYGQPPVRSTVPSRREPPQQMDMPDRPNAGGFFGQEPSTTTYTEKSGNNDPRNVVETLEEVVSGIQQGIRLSPMDSRQLRQATNKLKQLRGL
eukprot:UN28062